MERVSVIIPCRNEKPHLEAMLKSMEQTPVEDILEVIVIDDGSEDGCCDFLKEAPEKGKWPVRLVSTKDQGPAKARNLGAELAQGELLLFCDAHLLINDFQWISEIKRGFQLAGQHTGAICPGIGATTNNEAVGYGGTLDSNLGFNWLARPKEVKPVPIGPGGCLAVKKQVFQDCKGFEQNFPTWGFEDVEFSLRMWLFGYEVAVQPSTMVLHEFRRQHPYPINYLDTDYNLMWLAICHFDSRRLLKVAEQVAARNNLPVVLEKLFTSSVWQYSQQYRQRRVRDDQWLFEKFNISF